MTNQPSQRSTWITLGLILICAAGLRLRLLGVPLERDEGEYAYAGQLLLEGLPPYQLAYNLKMPGSYAAYAGLMAVFGQTHTGIHLGLLFVNAASILLVFLLARRLFDARVGVLAAAAFAVLSISRGVLGFTANAEQLVLPPALAGMLALLRGVQAPRRFWFFLSGLLLGVGFLMKQHGSFFILFAASYLLYLDWEGRASLWRTALARWLPFAAGALLPFGATCLYLHQAGVFGAFWFWVFRYALEYVSQVSPLDAISWLPGNLAKVVGPCLGLWLFAGVGLIASQRRPAAESAGIYLGLLAFWSLLSVVPGFYFRPHYFILALPAVAIAAAQGLDWAGRRLFGAGPGWRPAAGSLLLSGLVLLDPIRVEAPYLFQWSPEQVSRRSYGIEPFPESLVIAEQLKRRAAPGDRIAVIGSEPQIYFYSQLRSATGYLYTYSLMEVQPFALAMQEQMIREVELNAPAFLVHVHIDGSWGEHAQSQQHIFEWLERYQEGFERIGLVVLEGEDAILTRYYWDEAARQQVLPAAEQSWIAILKRKPRPAADAARAATRASAGRRSHGPARSDAGRRAS
ncbi:MAG TPA: glycosyltransferase family 39 protein [Myxococcota bacterium]|jgi:hypothetical protein